MSRILAPSLFLTLVALVGTAPVSAQTALVRESELDFPMEWGESWSPLAFRFDPVPERMESLAGRSVLGLRRVPVPAPAAEDGFELLDLDLERFHVISAQAEWRVNGEVVGGRAELEATHSLWRGSVRGEPGSDVYLAFTSTGSRGWIDRAGGKLQLISVPVDGDWTNTYSVLVHEADPMLQSGAADYAYACQTLTPSGGVLSPPPADSLGASRGVRTWECKLALETDYQFWQLFGDTTAATNYAISVFGAVSDRFLDACNMFISLPYVGIYSDPNDPWTQQDIGGGAGDVLNEFRSAWGGMSLPGNAHLAHLISGASLGGGVAYLNVLCNQDYGFAVSGNLHGQTNFPVPSQDALNWDFFVSAHETGHNVGTPHTHDYCPPIDECAGAGAFGSCQTSQVCQIGTIMSYCHGCPGGMVNVKSEFHPTVGALLVGTVQASCLPSYPAASTVVRLGTPGNNPAGYTSLTNPEIGTTWLAAVDILSVGASNSYIAGTTAGPASSVFFGAGEILINILQPFGFSDISAGFHVVPVPSDPSLIGTVLYTQAATIGGSLQLQNAIDLYFGR